MVQPFWKCLAIPQKAKHIIIVLYINSTLGYTPQKLESESLTDICSHVHSSIILKSQKVETPQLQCPQTLYTVYTQWNIIQPQNGMEL